jgi:hypothetical protein
MGEESLLRPADAPPAIYGSDGQPQFFDDPAMDRFVAVVLNLASELWVQEERLRALESDAGKPSRDNDPAQAVQAFIDRVFAPLRGA